MLIIFNLSVGCLYQERKEKIRDLEGTGLLSHSAGYCVCFISYDGKRHGYFFKTTDNKKIKKTQLPVLSMCRKCLLTSPEERPCKLQHVRISNQLR